MRESAVMFESKRTSSEPAENIEIRRFRGKGKRQRCKRCLTIEPGTPDTRASQKVGNGFQAVNCILCHLFPDFGASRVNASGTTVISAGRLPINSPSAST